MIRAMATTTQGGTMESTVGQRAYAHGTIQLVDERDRTVATLPLFGGNPERELLAAIARWRSYDVVGGYARDDSGRLLAYA